MQKKYGFSNKFMIKLLSTQQDAQIQGSYQLDIFKMEHMIQLSPNLQEEISVALCKPILETIDFFKSKPQFFLS